MIILQLPLPLPCLALPRLASPRLFPAVARGSRFPLGQSLRMEAVALQKPRRSPPHHAPASFDAAFFNVQRGGAGVGETFCSELCTSDIWPPRLHCEV
jgi:hypothetical protein